MMIKIGLTGGIGSGKTIVSKIWQKCGAYVVNADDLAKKIMVSNSAVKQELIHTFGAKAYRNDGSLNREFLAAEAFEKGRVSELNEIVHPKMPQKVAEIVQKAQVQNYPVLVYEAALLMQSLEAYSFDFVVLVLADEKKRIRRVEQRDGTSKRSIINRMKKQPDFTALTDSADFVIHNEGTLTDLEQKAEALYYEIRSKK